MVKNKCPITHRVFMKNFSTKNTFTYGQHGNNCVSSKLKPIPWFYPENKKPVWTSRRGIFSSTGSWWQTESIHYKD